MTTELVLTPINGEPRVHDLNLAERLGFDRPTKIRELIKRYREKLSKFNHIPTVGRWVELGDGAKRKVQEYYLDMKQAIFICMKSETDRAFEVQVEIVEVFAAYQNGTLQHAQPTVPGLLANAMRQIAHSFDAIDQRLQQTDQRFQQVDQRFLHQQTQIDQLKLRRQRSAPVINQLQIGLDLEPPAEPSVRVHQGGTHASPKPHRRSGHYRTLQRGDRIYVSPTWVGHKTH